MAGWGHTLTVGADGRGAPDFLRVCGTPRCGEPATHALTYEYVTGQRGRVSDAVRPLCERHARLAAQKHNLVYPPLDEQVLQALVQDARLPERLQNAVTQIGDGRWACLGPVRQDQMERALLFWVRRLAHVVRGGGA